VVETSFFFLAICTLAVSVEQSSPSGPLRVKMDRKAGDLVIVIPSLKVLLPLLLGTIIDTAVQQTLLRPPFPLQLVVVAGAFPIFYTYARILG